nr:oligosaccharide flippase family protein [Bifidobacterium sp. DSM 109957]
MINIGLFGLSAVATKLMAFILMPLYTLHFTTGEYGVMDMATILITLLFPILTLLISEGMLRFILDDKANVKFYITESFVVMTASCMVLLALLPLLDLPIFGGLGEYKWWFLLSYIALCFPTVMSTVARALDQTRLMAYASILSAILMGIIAYVTIARMNLGLIGYFYSYIIGNGSAALIYIVGGRQYQFISLSEWINKRHLRKDLWRYSLPLAPNSLCDQIQTTASRLILTGTLGISFSGLYAAASKIPNLLNVLQQIFSLAWQISTFQEFRSRSLKHFYDVIWRGYNAIMVLGSSLVILLTSFIAKILMQGSFYAVWPITTILVLSFYLASLSNFLGTIYQAYMHTNSLLLGTFAGTMVCIAWTATTVSHLGIVSAATGALIANLLIFIIRAIDTRKFMKIDFHIYKFLTTLFLLAAQTTIVFLQFTQYQVFSLFCFLGITLIQCFELLPFMKIIVKKKEQH